jgi:DNA gyrase inhibitor GyrI/DNA-binding transcriptional ArsR family regulator
MSMDDASISRTRRLFPYFSRPILQILQAIADESRFKILTILLDHQTTFQEIEAIVGLAKTATAHHLKVLISLRLIQKIKRGIYEITDDGKQILSILSTFYNSSNLRRVEEIQVHTRDIYSDFSPEKKKDVTQKIENLRIEIKNLPPMRIASARVISKTPEQDTWKKLEQFATPLGLLTDFKNARVFGFNNPDPIKGQPEYGYEFWIQVDSSVKPVEGISIKEFPGGLYATAKCNLRDELASGFIEQHGIMEAWFLLNKWVQNSIYEAGNHQWLERMLASPSGTVDIEMELYHPIQRKEPE